MSIKYEIIRNGDSCAESIAIEEVQNRAKYVNFPFFTESQKKNILDGFGENIHLFECRAVGSFLLEISLLQSDSFMDSIKSKFGCFFDQLQICKNNINYDKNKNHDNKELYNTTLMLIDEYKTNFFIQAFIFYSINTRLSYSIDDALSSLDFNMQSEFIDFLFSKMLHNEFDNITPEIIDTYCNILFKQDRSVRIVYNSYVNPYLYNFFNAEPFIVESGRSVRLDHDLSDALDYFFQNNILNVSLLPTIKNTSISVAENMSVKDFKRICNNLTQSEMEQEFLRSILWRELMSVKSFHSNHLATLSLLPVILFNFNYVYGKFDYTSFKEPEINLVDKIDSIFRNGFTQNDLQNIFIHAVENDVSVLSLFYTFLKEKSLILNLLKSRSNSLPHPVHRYLKTRYLRNLFTKSEEELIHNNSYALIDYYYSKKIDLDQLIKYFSKLYPDDLLKNVISDKKMFFKNICTYLYENKTNIRRQESMVSSFKRHLDKMDDSPSLYMSLSLFFNGQKNAVHWHLSSFFILFSRFGSRTHFRKCENENCDHYFIPINNNQKFCKSSIKDIFDPQTNSYISCDEYLNKNKKYASEFTDINQKYSSYRRNIENRSFNQFQQFFGSKHSNVLSINNRQDQKIIDALLNKWFHTVYSIYQNELFSDMQDELSKSKFKNITVEHYRNLYNTFHSITVLNNPIKPYDLIKTALDQSCRTNLLTLRFKGEEPHKTYMYESYNLDDIKNLCENVKFSIYHSLLTTNEILDKNGKMDKTKKPFLRFKTDQNTFEDSMFEVALEIPVNNDAKNGLGILYKEVNKIIEAIKVIKQNQRITGQDIVR